MIESCNIDELQQKTGIYPRDSWFKKARNYKVYYINKNGRYTAFLYIKDAKNYLKTL